MNLKTKEALMLAAVSALLLTGCTASKPAAAPAAAGYEKLIVISDTVRGAANVDPKEMPLKVCVPNARWMHNERAIWRIKVIDPKTGAQMDDKALSKVEVKLSDGQTLPAVYGDHPGNPGAKPTDHFWTTGWTIPETYPTGTVKYQVSAVAKDGRASDWVSFDVDASAMIVLDGKVPVVAPPGK